MRCFVIPRGSVILAGGPAAPDAAEFVMRAAVGSETYGVLSNQYLAEAARCIRYEVTVSVCDAEYRYRSTTSIEHQRIAGEIGHQRPFATARAARRCAGSTGLGGLIA
jgi:hypothetical protein